MLAHLKKVVFESNIAVFSDVWGKKTQELRLLYYLKDFFADPIFMEKSFEVM